MATKRSDGRINVPTVGTLDAVTPDTGQRLREVMAGKRAWIRELATETLQQPGFEPVYGWDGAAHRERIKEQVERIASTPLTSIGFPASVGGDDDPGAFVTGFEMLSYADISLQVKVGVHFGLFGGAVQHLGTEEHHQRFLPGVIDFSLPGCFAMTETGHGSDVQSLRTVATYDPETQEFDLHTTDRAGWKDYIGNAAAHAKWAAVFAQLETQGERHGVHCFLVQLRDDDGNAMPGVLIGDDGHKLGLNGVDNGRLAFQHVRVPRADLLNRYGDVAEDGTYSSPIESQGRRFFTMLGTLVQGRVAVSGAGVGAAKLALTIATRHAYTRTQFEGEEEGTETLLMDYLSHQKRILPRIARTYALHFAQQQLVDTFHEAFTSDDEYPEDARKKLEARAAGTKALSTWHATDSIQEAREACGGFGYLSENRLGQLKSDMDVFTTFEGDNTVLMQLVAKSLLTNYSSEMGAMDTPETILFGLEQVLDAVVDFSRGRQLLENFRDAVRREDEDILFDRTWQREMFASHAKDLLQSCAMRLRSLMKDRSSFDAFNFVQDHVLKAAHAEMERVVLNAFNRAVEAAEDPGVKQVLDTLCSLHALSVIERDRGWFMSHGYLTANRSKSIVGTVNGLCRDLRPYAQLLARSMGVPDELVLAPVAMRKHGEDYLDARERLGWGKPDNVSGTSGPAVNGPLGAVSADPS